MRVIKKINNNAAICLDDNNCELVAFGTGIGFPKCPYEIEDLSVVQRTYYNVDSVYYKLLNQIPEDVVNVTIQIVDEFRNVSDEAVNPNLVFTLADHIQFAIERTQKNIKINTPLCYDIKHLYEVEYELGLKAIKMVQKQLNVRLPKNEASNIAMHFINAKGGEPSSRRSYADSVVEDITEIVGRSFGIYIDKNTFNYSRFVTHLYYLLKREQNGELISSDNKRMYGAVIEEYKETYECCLKIKEYIKEELNMDLNDEEILYLILHVNRLCVREDCYRKSITPAQ